MIEEKLSYNEEPEELMTCMKSPGLENLVERAVGYQKSGDYERACRLYRGLLRRGCLTARILTNYGAAIYDAGESLDGVCYFERALEIDPFYQDAWRNLLVYARDSGELDRILIIAERAIDASLDNKQAVYARAQLVMLKGRFSEAQQIFARLLEDDPDNLEYHEFIARCYLACADLDSALGHLLYIISINPGDSFASVELAEMAAKVGDLESSMEILKSAHEIHPEDTRIILKMAREYQLRGRMYEALGYYELALSVEPDSALLLANLAYCHSELGEVTRFFEIYDDLMRRQALTSEMLVAAIFICSIQGSPYLDKLREYSQMFWESIGSKALVNPEPVSSASEQESLTRPVLPVFRAVQKRRIGIVTGGLGTHVESCFLGSFLLNYSKDLFEVEVVSNRWLNDSISEVLAQSVDRCHSISNLPLAAARELILRQDYDLILETTGFTSGSAIHVLAERCAPVQCHWIGYHASTYMPTMDYFIGDHVLIPDDHVDRFSEQVIRLNRAWLAATPFMPIPEAKAPTSETVMLGSFSQVAKLTQATLELWASILLAAPQCNLIFKDKFTNDPTMVAKVMASFADQGVDPQRIVFMPRSDNWFEHMAMYNLIDIALDTTPWSSATTAFDALSMGVPLIAIQGQTTSGLMSSSVLYHGGKKDWIARDKGEFVEKNMALIENVSAVRARRRALQGEILQSQLFDGSSIATAIEEFMLSI